MSAIDTFDAQPPITTYPARHLEAVTPHDTNELSNVSRGIYVGGAGDMTVLTANDEEVLLAAVPAGTQLPICIKRVNATGTDATFIVSLY